LTSAFEEIVWKLYAARLASAPGGLKLWLGDSSINDKSSRENILCVFPKSETRLYSPGKTG